MPLTFAHPLAVMPLKKILGKNVVFSALVIGSMMPDIDHFIPLYLLEIFTHRVSGIFEGCIPIGLVFFWIFHQFLKRPAIYLMPDYIQSRLQQFDQPFPLFQWKQFLLVCYYLGIGAFSHILWDAATHDTGFIVKIFPIFNYQLLQISGLKLTIYKLLQHGGSIVGLLILGYMFIKWLAAQPGTIPVKKYTISPKIRSYIWIGVMLLPMLIWPGSSTLFDRAAGRLCKIPPLRSFHSCRSDGQLYAALYALGRRVESLGTLRQITTSLLYVAAPK